MQPLLLRGLRVPRFLYGTAWKEERTQALTSLALGAGFRGIDTANQRKHYFEAGVGQALSEAIESGLLPREQLFLQTKFTFAAGQDQRLPYDPKASFATQVEQSLASSLEHLRTTYLDSYVLHGPESRAGISPADEQVWRAMEAVHASGQARLLGVSNVSLSQLQRLFELARVKPAFVQNRCYARTGWDREVRHFCRANDLVYQGFSLLTANRSELASQAVAAIRKRLACSLPELVFKLALELGMLPLTGTSSEEHMRLDLRCHELELTAADATTLERIAG